MQILFSSQFLKDIQRNANSDISQIVLNIIDSIKSADSILPEFGIKKLSGFKEYYRIRVRSYRIGLKIKDDIVVFERLLHRKEIYRYFP